MPEPLQQVNASLPAALVAFIQRQAAQTVRTMGVFPGENISIGKGEAQRANAVARAYRKTTLAYDNFGHSVDRNCVVRAGRDNSKAHDALFCLSR